MGFGSVRRFESVYRPEKNEIVRCTMKSELGSDEIFGVPPLMKLNPPLLSPRSGISSRSDFIHQRWIYSAIGGFSCKAMMGVALNRYLPERNAMLVSEAYVITLSHIFFQGLSSRSLFKQLLNVSPNSSGISSNRFSSLAIA